MIRRIKFIGGKTGKRLVFLTNNMQVDAVTIAQVDKNRWHVELFFKWIKQHLCVKRFFGRSDNLPFLRIYNEEITQNTVISIADF